MSAKVPTNSERGNYKEHFQRASEALLLKTELEPQRTQSYTEEYHRDRGLRLQELI
jgi:hypothetical protein